VQGPGGPQTTDTVVTVEAVAPPVANAGPAQTVLVGNTVTLDGSASTGATSFAWSQTGGTPVTLSSTTAVKPTFKMPNTTNPLNFQLTVSGPGGTDVATVQINPQADVLTTTRVEFRTGTGEWRVEGTAQVTASNTITVHIGNTLSGQVLGTASPDALGVWSVRLIGPPPDGTRTVSIESSRGGVLLGVAINVRN
jgi:K319L-like, PKD domain